MPALSQSFYKCPLSKQKLQVERVTLFTFCFVTVVVKRHLTTVEGKKTSKNLVMTRKCS